MISNDLRCDRFFTSISSKKKSINDFRSPFEHDHDRLIYSGYLRRLACVTQIFNPSEGVIFHNRLTHTIKVSQIATRIAQKILTENDYADLLNIGGLDCNVVCTAALAHDLGNPPFGHAAEAQLDKRIKEDEGIIDGFEGNAQSFRIVTELSAHNEDYRGLNLTRATLNAILKYPWKRIDRDQKKFGVYSSEEKYFKFARQYSDLTENMKCLEAAIMDISDDITYAIHDLSDLLKQGLISFHDISKKLEKIQQFGEDEFTDERNFPQFSMVFDLINILNEKSYNEEWAPEWSKNREIIINKLSNFFTTYELYILGPNYQAYFRERVLLKEMEDYFISRFIGHLEINCYPKSGQPILFLEAEAADALIIIKALTKCYIINSSALIKQQLGEREIINELFTVFKDSISDLKLRIILPARSREELHLANIKDPKDPRGIRIIADAISGLTDSEAISTYYVTTGVKPGSIFDRISM